MTYSNTLGSIAFFVYIVICKSLIYKLGLGIERIGNFNADFGYLPWILLGAYFYFNVIKHLFKNESYVITVLLIFCGLASVLYKSGINYYLIISIFLSQVILAIRFKLLSFSDYYRRFDQSSNVEVAYRNEIPGWKKFTFILFGFFIVYDPILIRFLATTVTSEHDLSFIFFMRSWLIILIPLIFALYSKDYNVIVLGFCYSIYHILI